MSTLSEAYKDHALHLHHIIPLEFDSVQDVPESHAWPQSIEHEFRVPSSEQLSIPIIDFMDPNAAKLVGHACETWGAFQLTNHGLPLGLLEDVESEAQRLFSLPAQQKMKALRSPGGATGYGIARMSPFFNKLMWHEGFTVIGSSADHAKELWPHDNEKFCDAMDKYQKKMKALADRLMFLILDSFGISQEDINQSRLYEILKNPCTALQLNHYPSCPNPKQAVGLAPHTDTFLFTILHQSNTSGLQIFRDEVGWVSISPVKGALVVNVGDLFHILSNARFPSVLHRVMVNENKNRLSIAYFYGPPTYFQVSPLSKLVDFGQFSRFRSLTVQEYIDMRAKHLDKALSLLRI